LNKPADRKPLAEKNPARHSAGAGVLDLVSHRIAVDALRLQASADFHSPPAAGQ